jgi:hypothetical protein
LEAAQGLQGLQGLQPAAAQGLQGLQAGFRTEQGLQGLQAAAAQGLQGLQEALQVATWTDVMSRAWASGNATAPTARVATLRATTDFLIMERTSSFAAAGPAWPALCCFQGGRQRRSRPFTFPLISST